MTKQTEALLEEEEDTQKGRYLTFVLGKETYGIEICYVKEIVGIQQITAMPDLSEYVRGIINLRGNIIPVMDVRIRFKKEFRPYTDRTCIIVIHIAEQEIGLIVDSVAEVMAIAEENIVKPPAMKTESGNKYIKNIGKVGTEVKLLLDCEKMIGEEELEQILELV